jgi:hypothetical protein
MNPSIILYLVRQSGFLLRQWRWLWLGEHDHSAAERFGDDTNIFRLVCWHVNDPLSRTALGYVCPLYILLTGGAKILILRTLQLAISVTDVLHLFFPHGPVIGPSTLAHMS